MDSGTLSKKHLTFMYIFFRRAVPATATLIRSSSSLGQEVVLAGGLFGLIGSLIFSKNCMEFWPTNCNFFLRKPAFF